MGILEMEMDAVHRVLLKLDGGVSIALASRRIVNRLSVGTDRHSALKQKRRTSAMMGTQLPEMDVPLTVR